MATSPRTRVVPGAEWGRDRDGQNPTSMDVTRVYIVDYLGSHCGMHYYDEAFRQVLERVPGVEAAILSNFPTRGSRPFFLDQYHCGKARGAVAMLRNAARLSALVKREPGAWYVFLSYGNIECFPLLRAATAAPRHLVDIHEAVAQARDASRWVRRAFAGAYAGRVRRVIVHSERTGQFLDGFGYKGQRLSVPHFRYVFPRRYDTARVGQDVAHALDPGRLNVLFFGNLNANKGVDVLLEAVNRVDPATAARLNVVVAGKDNDGACRSVATRPGRRVTLVTRHITDDELIFLYKGADMVALPYRKTSQSGILEMAFYFNKPILASDLPYFRDTLAEFPSFGRLAPCDADGYARALERMAGDWGRGEFFAPADTDRYLHRAAIDDFVGDFARLIAQPNNIEP